MITKQTSLTSITHTMSMLNKTLVFLMVVALFLFSLFFWHYSDSELQIKRGKKTEKKMAEECNYDQIGRGALSLKSEIQNFPFPDLSGEVLFLGKNTRPDATLYDLKLCMGLKGCDQTLKIAPGQKLYLAYQKKSLNFSKATTPLWIKPYLNEKGEAWLEMGIRLVSDVGEVLLEETRAFEIESKLKYAERQSEGALALGAEDLKLAKWWAPDRLYENYGGTEYQNLVGSERLQFDKEGRSQFLHVKEGDLFVWKEGMWQASDITKGYPLARLKTASPYALDWELWSENGLDYIQLSHSKERASGIRLRIEETFTRMRQRTSSRISCRVDNKALILKKGDWLIHLPTGWQVLRSLKDVEAVLQFETQGELFVFDGLEKTEGKPVFCGTLFDPMRTQTQNVRLPFTQGNGREYSPPTKKAISTKIRPSASNDEPLKKEKLKRARQKLIKRQEPLDNYGMLSEE